MLAIITDYKVIYLGDDRDKALHVYSMAIEHNKCFAEVNSLEQLEQMLRRPEVSVQPCDLCDRPARWARATQFAGEHFFCAEHAEQETSNEDDRWRKL